jgi:hypothetical protein
MGNVITSRFVETAKPKLDAAGVATRTEYPDAACPGLHLVVQPTGARSWAFRYRRPDRKSVKLTLGNAGEGGLTLAAARHAAAAARHQLEQGIPSSTATADAGRARNGVTLVTPKSGGGRGCEAGDSIESAVAWFLESHVRRKNRPSTAQAVESILNRLVLPVGAVARSTASAGAM